MSSSEVRRAALSLSTAARWAESTLRETLWSAQLIVLSLNKPVILYTIKLVSPLLTTPQQVEDLDGKSGGTNLLNK